MDSIEKASILMGKSYTKTQEGAAHSSNVTMITGTATSDSTDGVVSVDLGGNTISANDEQSVEIATTCAVKAGDIVQVSVIGADGTAKSLLVTGVIAGGDRMNENIEAASSDASAAKETADAAQQVADVANTNASNAQKTANTTKKYFYNDESGSHVRNQDSTSAGTRADVKTDGLHITDQDDGKELASFTSSGASIGKDSETHSRYTSDGVHFYEGGKSYPFSQIKPVTYKNEKYSAAVFTTAPDDISTDDGLYHSGATVDVTAINGTATDNTGTGRVTLTATTVQSADPKEAYIDVFASNNNPNKASGGKTVEDTYINLVAEGIYFNSIKLPKIVQGTKVVNPTGTSAALFSKSELASILGVPSIDTDKLTIAVSNGDVSANGVHIESAAFASSWDSIFVVFASSTSKAYRVNYLIAYNG